MCFVLNWKELEDSFYKQDKQHPVVVRPVHQIWTSHCPGPTSRQQHQKTVKQKGVRRNEELIGCGTAGIEAP